MKSKTVLAIVLFGGLTGLLAATPGLTERVKTEVKERVSGEAMSEWRRSEGAQARVEWPRDNPPRPLPARPVTFPPYEIRKLANGMQVVLVSQNEPICKDLPTQDFSRVPEASLIVIRRQVPSHRTVKAHFCSIT